MILPKPVLPYQCDVLVYDTLGSPWIHHCIPNSATWRLIDIRHNRPLFLDYRFFSRLAHLYFRDRSAHSYGRYFCYLSALFHHINPKVILTFADNNVVLGPYAAQSSSTLVVSIQNGIRGTTNSIPAQTVLPIYYALGNAEKDVFKMISVTHQEYIPIGSVKLGLFLQQHLPKDNIWDLAFCSHYRPELVKTNASPLFRLIEESHRHLFRLTCQYARINNRSIAVLSKTREPKLQKLEEIYFHNLAGGYPFHFILADKSENEFATYQGAFSSRLVINLCSTLGYEAFGAGRKVLFGASYNQKLLEQWGVVQYYQNLPRLICLRDDSLARFSEQVDMLLHMEKNIYKERTQIAASYYLAMPDSNYPHEVIRQRIANHLANS